MTTPLHGPSRKHHSQRSGSKSPDLASPGSGSGHQQAYLTGQAWDSQGGLISAGKGFCPPWKKTVGAHSRDLPAETTLRAVGGNTQLIFVSISWTTRTDLTVHNGSGTMEADVLFFQLSAAGISDGWARCPHSSGASCLRPPRPWPYHTPSSQRTERLGASLEVVPITLLVFPWLELSPTTTSDCNSIWET